MLFKCLVIAGLLVPNKSAICSCVSPVSYTHLDVYKRQIEKYKGLSKDDHVFPVPSSSRCNVISVSYTHLRPEDGALGPLRPPHPVEDQRRSGQSGEGDPLADAECRRDVRHQRVEIDVVGCPDGSQTVHRGVPELSLIHI